MNKNILSCMLIAVAASCWGLISLGTRSLAALGFSPMMMIFVRALITSVFLGLWLVLKNRAALRIKLKDLWCFLGTGLASLVFFNFCYFSAINIMNASAAVVLLYTSPAFVVLLSAPLFREKITPMKLVAVALVLAGAICTTGIIGSGQALSVQGLLLGLGAGFGYALYSIFSRFAIQRGYGSSTITLYTFALAAVGTLPFIDYSTLSSLTLGAEALAWSLFLGLLCCLIPYLMYTEGLNHVENGPASVIASLEIVVATLVGVVAWGERLDLLGIAGILLIICGIGVMNARPRKRS